MGYVIISILLIVFIGLWGMARENLSLEEQENKRLEKTITSIEESNSRHIKQINELFCQQKQDIKSVVKYLLTATNQDSSAEMVETVINHLSYVGDIKSVSDLLEYDFNYVVKVALYAEKGLLGIYQDMTSLDERLFLITEDDDRIYLSDDDIKRISNRDYSFIFNNYIK